MNLINWTDPFYELPYLKDKAAATIGVFDGLHLGHIDLIKKVVSKAPDFVPAVFTFKKNPKNKVRENYKYAALLTHAQKLEILESTGVKLCVLIDFSEKFSKLSGRDFVSILVNNFGVRAFVAGKDFKFGYQHSTDSGALKQIAEGLGADTEIVEAVSFNGAVISSSRIRSAIMEGRTDLAFAMLGRPYSIDLREAELNYGNGCFQLDLKALKLVIPAAGQYTGILDYGSIKESVQMDLGRDGMLVCKCKPDEHSIKPVNISFDQKLQGLI